MRIQRGPPHLLELRGSTYKSRPTTLESPHWKDGDLRASLRSSSSTSNLGEADEGGKGGTRARLQMHSTPANRRSHSSSLPVGVGCFEPGPRYPLVASSWTMGTSTYPLSTSYRITLEVANIEMKPCVYGVYVAFPTIDISPGER